MTPLAFLPERAVLAVTGADRVSFLNGLVSNDVSLVTRENAVWAALLTPQGKYLADFFILTDGGRLLIDCERPQRDMLLQKLSRFRLRADVAIAPLDLAVHAAWDGAPTSAALTAPDPRLPEAGWRILADTPLAATADFAAWDLHRLRLGLPDGTSDLEPEKSVLLEAGFDELHGISWTKGCYMGQELTARTRYRGLLKRRLLPVRGAMALPSPGTPILAGDREAGVLRSVIGTEALALLRLDSLRHSLSAGGVTLSVHVPSWARLPEDVPA